MHEKKTFDSAFGLPISLKGVGQRAYTEIKVTDLVK
jgi:hypothetical protein